MKFTNLYINDTDYISYLPYPTKEVKVRDESLDNMTIQLVNMGNINLDLPENHAFKPFTEVRFVNIQGENISTVRMYIVQDKCEEIRTSGTFTHTLYLMEQTKILERVLIGGKTHTLKTNKLNTVGVPQNRYNFSQADSRYQLFAESFKSPVLLGNEINIIDLFTDYNPRDYVHTISITASNGDVIFNQNVESYAFIPPHEDLFTIREQVTLGGTVQGWIEFAIYVTANQENKSIADVIDTILSTCETLLVGETPRFYLSEADRVELEQIESPQFSFTNQMSLWEVFSMIGDYIHAIPRLEANGRLTFDKLGEETLSTLDFDNYVINEENCSVEQFCSEVISTVDNLTTYEREGAVVDIGNNYKTLRVETGVAYIDEGSLKIQTSFPIEQLVSVECGYTPDDTLVGDITQYVVEKTDYDCLSSFQSNFPNAKCYAIYWTRGEKNIDGLTFKKPALIGAFQNYAIQNIICAKTGKALDWFTTLFENELALQNLMFKVKYIPRIKSRLSQCKQYVEDLQIKSQVAYNQNSTLIDSQAYGESMKGLVARLGNVEIVRTYIFEKEEEIPKIGSYVLTESGDQYYLTEMIIQRYPDFIECQIGFTKDFNRYNEYVGIKNELRFYEVAVDQVYDRFVNINDYCLIGESVPWSDNKQLIKQGGITTLAMSFANTNTSDNKLKTVYSRTQLSNGNEIVVLLPVISMGIGTSIMVEFGYPDNFSAGDKIVLSNNIRVQQQVQYGDVIGEAETMTFDVVANNPQFLNYAQNKEWGDNLPDVELDVTSTQLSTSTPIVLKKDNREVINVVYQLNFVTSDKSIIIGQALGQRNGLVSTASTNFKLYVSQKRIRKFDKIIDTSNMTEYALNSTTIMNSVTSNKFSLGNFTPTQDGKAWLIVNDLGNGTGELVIAQNTTLTANKTFALPYFNFTHEYLGF